MAIYKVNDPLGDTRSSSWYSVLAVPNFEKVQEGGQRYRLGRGHQALVGELELSQEYLRSVGDRAKDFLMKDEAEDIIKELLSVYGEHYDFHSNHLNNIPSTASPFTNIEEFFYCLYNYTDLIILLEYTRFSRVPLFSNDKRSESQTYISDYIWEKAFSALFQDLYVAASRFKQEQVKMVYIPTHISFDLLRTGKLNMGNLGKVSRYHEDITLLNCYLGNEFVSISDYLLALSFNLARLRTQRDSDYENHKPWYTSSRTNAVEVAIYYIASNIGVDSAIYYLEQLWNFGWLHNSVFYAGLWTHLKLWRISHPELIAFPGERMDYVESILFLDKNHNVSLEVINNTAKNLLDQIRLSLKKAQSTKNLSLWIRILHAQTLRIHAIYTFKQMLDLVLKESSREFTQIWRYCSEISVDIASLIANPFFFHPGRLKHAAFSSKNLREAKRKMKFFTQGRVSFPEHTFQKIERIIISSMEDDVSPITLECNIADVILNDLDFGLRDMYQSIYPVSAEQINIKHQKEHYLLDSARADLEGIKPEIVVVASFLLGMRVSHMMHGCMEVRQPTGDFESIARISSIFDEFGNLVELNIRPYHNPSFTQNEILEFEKEISEKIYDWIIQSSYMLTFMDASSEMNQIPMRHISIDFASSNVILFLEFSDGIPKKFTLLPRSFLGQDKSGLPNNDEALASGVCSASLYTQLRKGSYTGLRGVNIGNLPLNLAFIKTDRGYMSMTFGDSANIKEVDNE